MKYSPYVYVKDINGKKVKMTVEKFNGMLFSHCFQLVKSYRGNSNVKLIYHIVEAIHLKYREEEYVANLFIKVIRLNKNNYHISVTHCVKMIFSVQFQYLIPLHIGNYVTIFDIKESLC